MPNSVHLTVLVPARNAEQLLPGWLASVSGYADAVIALDDGSTDGTRAVLEAHPLVTRVLANPVRRSYVGWDDLTNRQQLVDAALHDGAQWLFFLDSDEHVDADDGRALRRFLSEEARPGFAYGFEVFRMVDDEHHYDPRAMWVFRLFAALDAIEPLGSQRLHFVPVPSGIPRERWLRTSVRIQHFGSLTASHRQARFDKYREADPDNECQDDYTTLLSDPELVAPWPVRAPDVAVLLGVEGRYVDLQSRLDDASAAPAISAVVIAQNDVAVIDRSLRALTSQVVDDEFEIILVGSGSDETVAYAHRYYPELRCVQLPAPALPGEARNAGLWMARGEFVTFPGSHVWLQPGSLAARLRAHDEGWDLVTGAVINGNTTRAGWASYFLDHAVQNPSRASGEFHGVPGHVSYLAEDVRAVGGFPEDMRAGADTVVNRKLFFAGKRTYFCAEAAFAHASPSTTVRQLLRHHYGRGRALGRIMRGVKPRTNAGQLFSVASHPARRLRPIARAMRDADAELRAEYRRVRPLVVAGALAASTGTVRELLARTPASAPVAARDRPVPQEWSGPILALSGRPVEAKVGVLAAGTPAQAAQRLMTFTRYAEFVCAVRPALAPIVTSATITAEYMGTYTIDVPRASVDAYLHAAREVGASLLLQLQPGRAELSRLIERWQKMLAEPDVGVLFDLRALCAFAEQERELDDAVARLRSVGGESTLILVRGAQAPRDDVVVVPDTFDLRRPGTPLPHDALRASRRPSVLVYE